MQDYMLPPDLAATIVSFMRKILAFYLSSILFIPIVSVLQERRIWNPSHLLPSLSIFAHVRIYFFNVLWMTLSLIGGVLLLPKYFSGKLFGYDCRHDAYIVERFTAEMCFYLFVGTKPEIRGFENLPIDKESVPAPVYVANHASQIDVAAVYFIGRRFKWISKNSVRYLPGVGLIMSLSEHVFIQRKGRNKKSVSQLYQESNKAIQSGLPIFFFPQGTRRMEVRLPFKDGAYNVALENESQLIPISIEIPLCIWNNWYPLCLLWQGKRARVILTIHKPVDVKKTMDREELRIKTSDIIYSVLPCLGVEEAKGTKKEK